MEFDFNFLKVRTQLSMSKKKIGRESPPAAPFAAIVANLLVRGRFPKKDLVIEE